MNKVKWSRVYLVFVETFCIPASVSPRLPLGGIALLSKLATQKRRVVRGENTWDGPRHQGFLSLSWIPPIYLTTVTLLISLYLSKVPPCYWVLLTLFFSLGASEGKLPHQENRETKRWLPSSANIPPPANKESLLPLGFVRRHGFSQVQSHPHLPLF